MLRKWGCGEGMWEWVYMHPQTHRPMHPLTLPPNQPPPHPPNHLPTHPIYQYTLEIPINTFKVFKLSQIVWNNLLILQKIWRWEGMWEWVYMYPHTHTPTHPPTNPNTHPNNIYKLFRVKIMKILITFLSISQPIFNPWGCTLDMTYNMYTGTHKKKIGFVSLKLLKSRTPPQKTLSSISQLLDHSGTCRSICRCSRSGTTHIPIFVRFCL